MKSYTTATCRPMDMNTLNVSATLNIFRLLARPTLVLPQATVSTFNHLPIPLNSAFGKYKKADIRAVVLDKDNCFAYPKSNDVHEPYNEKFKKLREAYPGRRLLIVSNTAGAESLDRSGKLAAEVETSTGVTVLPHASKKPGCGPDIMQYFSRYPETGVTRPDQIAIVGDRLTTDVMMANLMGSYSVWIKDGVVPVGETSVLARLEQKFAGWLIRRGYEAPAPASPFEK